MRINLATPFAEKDAAKALGAKWDSVKKNWYVVDAIDLTPFLRWIPNSSATTKEAETRSFQTDSTAAMKRSMPTRLVPDVPYCGCDVKPWEDCLHTTTSK